MTAASDVLRPRAPDLAAALAVVVGDAREWSGAPGVPPRRGGDTTALEWEPTAVRVSYPTVAAGATIAPSARTTVRADLAITDPRAAWEALATRGLIPADAVAASGRRFVPGGGRPAAADAYPAAVGDAVAFAACWGAVVTAEALAREICSRLGRGAAAAAAVWSVLPRSNLIARAAVAAVAWARCPPDACGPVDDLLGYQWAWVHDAVQPRRPPARARIDARDLVAADVVAAAAAVPDLLATGCVLTAIGDGAMDLALPGGAW